ncbi:hypothetical protein ACQKPT_10000 [Pseudomonas monteilii]|uniref:hypothetical protein n=1 Tax=Pseudomonas monteilii TaxID=76759 RepID=UPI003CFF7787
MTKIVAVEKWISWLGQSHAALLSHGLDPKLRFIKLYPGALDLYIEPEPGISYCFDAETKILQAIIVVFIREVESEPEFNGALSSPYNCPDKESVRIAWGQPSRCEGPTSLPPPIGKVGGWDIYEGFVKGQINTMLTYQYASDLRVSKVVLEAKASEN